MARPVNLHRASEGRRPRRRFDVEAKAETPPLATRGRLKQSAKRLFASRGFEGPAVREIFHELQGIRAAPVSQRELDDARSYLAGIFPLRLQTTEGVASRLAELALHDLPAGYFDDYRDRILAVTAEQVHDAATRHLRPDASTVVVVGDAAKVRGPLEELGLGPVRVLGADEVAG